MKILLAADDSEFSQAAAKSLAEQFRPQDTEVRVLHVVEPLSLSAPPQMSRGYYPELEQQLPHAHEIVERAATSSFCYSAPATGSLFCRMFQFFDLNS